MSKVLTSRSKALSRTTGPADREHLADFRRGHGRESATRRCRAADRQIRWAIRAAPRSSGRLKATKPSTCLTAVATLHELDTGLRDLLDAAGPYRVAPADDLDGRPAVAYQGERLTRAQVDEVRAYIDWLRVRDGARKR